MSEHRSPIGENTGGFDKITARAVAVMVIAAMVYMFAAFQYISPPVVALGISQSLGLGPDDMGLMFSATFIAYALMQPLAGFGADRFGPRRCLMFSTALTAVASIWFSRAGSLGSAATARALVGLAAGFAFVPTIRLAANWLPVRHFGMASSLVVAASALSSFLAGAPLAFFAGGFGWRWSFMMLGLISAGLCLIVWRVVKDRPASARPAAAGAGSPGSNFGSAAKIVLTNPVFWLMSLVYCGVDLIYQVFTGLWAGPYLIEGYGLSMAEAGSMLSTASVGLLFGGPLMILLANAWKSYTKMIITLAAFNVGLAAFLVWGPADAPLWMIRLLCLAAPVGAQGTALFFAVGRRIFPEQIVGTMTGFLNMVPFLFGAAMQSLTGRMLAGIRADHVYQDLGAHFQYSLAFKPILYCVLASLAAGFWLHAKAGTKES